MIKPILRGLLSWHLMLKVFLGPLLEDAGIQCHASVYLSPHQGTHRDPTDGKGDEGVSQDWGQNVRIYFIFSSDRGEKAENQ